MRKIKQNSIIFVILYGLIFYSINFILSINNIVFMNWIYYFSNGIIILGSIIGIYNNDYFFKYSYMYIYIYIID